MDSKDLIKAGRLSEARRQLTEEVRSAPVDSRKRTLLFQVLAFLGEWEKAERHLEVISAQGVKAETGVQAYKDLIAAEKERKEVLSLRRGPSFMTETPAYMELYFAGLERLAGGEIEEADSIFSRIETYRPRISGTANGQAFTGFTDSDTVLSFFLEVFVHERYVWLPFESLRELTITAPMTLPDLLWSTAQITTWEGLSLNCYIPVIYHGSSLHQDEAVAMGRMTDWLSLGGPFFRGAGQRVFQAGEREIAVLDVREILFNPPFQEVTNETAN